MPRLSWLPGQGEAALVLGGSKTGWQRGGGWHPKENTEGQKCQMGNPDQLLPQAGLTGISKDQRG